MTAPSCSKPFCMYHLASAAILSICLVLDRQWPLLCQDYGTESRDIRDRVGEIRRTGRLVADFNGFPVDCLVMR